MNLVYSLFYSLIVNIYSEAQGQFSLSLAKLLLLLIE